MKLPIVLSRNSTGNEQQLDSIFILVRTFFLLPLKRVSLIHNGGKYSLIEGDMVLN